MNDSGNTTSCAPLPAAWRISPAALATVASRLRNTGAAWTAATRTSGCVSPGPVILALTLRPASNEGQQLRLLIGIFRYSEILAKHTRPTEFASEFLGDGQAARNELSVEAGLLAGALGDVPAVNQDVHEQLAGVIRARVIAERQVARRLHRSGGIDSLPSNIYGPAVRRGGIVSSQIAVECSADLRDGLPMEELGGPEVLADDVVRDLLGVPLRTGRGHMPAVPRDLFDNAPRRLHCAGIELSVGHSTSLRWIGGGQRLRHVQRIDRTR